MPGVRDDQGPREKPWLEKKSENFPGGFISPPGIRKIHRPGQRVDNRETSLKTQATHFFITLSAYTTSGGWVTYSILL